MLRKVYHRKLIKGFGSKFSEGYVDQQAPEEGPEAKRLDSTETTKMKTILWGIKRNWKRD